MPYVGFGPVEKKTPCSRNDEISWIEIKMTQRVGDSQVSQERKRVLEALLQKTEFHSRRESAAEPWFALASSLHDAHEWRDKILESSNSQVVHTAINELPLIIDGLDLQLRQCSRLLFPRTRDPWFRPGLSLRLRR